MLLKGDNYRSMSDVIYFWGETTIGLCQTWYASEGPIEVSKFIIYSPYRVLMDLLIMIKKKWNIRHIYNIFRNKTLCIYKKEGVPYNSVGRESDWEYGLVHYRFIYIYEITYLENRIYIYIVSGGWLNSWGSRAVKGGRLKLYCYGFVGSNPTFSI